MKKTLAVIILLGLLTSGARALDLTNFQFPQKTLKKKSKKRSPTSVASIRGLDEPEGQGDSSARDYEAVERMEKVSLSKEEVAKFVKDGGLKGKL